jgi:serpin B
MRHKLVLATHALFVLAAARCSGSSGSDSTRTDGGKTVLDGGGTGITVDGQSVSIDKSTKERAAATSVSASDLVGAVTANNAFAVDLYGQLRAQSASSNLLSSPISASLALTMTYAGAQGTTATQMATALHYGSAASTIFDGQNALSQALASRGPAAFQASEGTDSSSDDYELQVVNAVWGEKSYPWEAPFLDILAEDYGTGVYLWDFMNDWQAVTPVINDWVSDETSNKIEDLLPSGAIKYNTRMVLVNAVHLKFPWATPFDPTETAPASFTTAAGSTVSTPFMNQTGEMQYVDDGNAQIVGLPLFDGQVAVVIALPHGDLATYEAGLTASSGGIKMPTESAGVELSLPKVSFTSPSFSLKTALTTMGMPLAFDAVHADFKGLCSSPPEVGAVLYIQDVLQKAMIGVEEGGVEAAAATAVIVGADAAVGDDAGVDTPVVMNVNRPYLLTIVDVPTNTVLFLGHIVDPTQAGGS